MALEAVSEQVAAGAEFDATMTGEHVEKTSATRPLVQQTAVV